MLTARRLDADNMHPQLKRGTLLLPNKNMLRLKSPRTMEAMLELGYDSSFFHLKQLHDFGGPRDNEEIKRIRYNHYLKKLLNAADEIQQRRKEIAENHRSLIYLEIAQPQSGIKSNRDQTVQQMMAQYDRTVKALKSERRLSAESHDSNTQENLSSVLQREVEKFKKLKFQQLREAKIRMSETTHRAELKDRIEKKEQRIYTYKDQSQREKMIRIKNRKMELEEKRDRIQDMRQEREHQRRLESERIAQKLERVREKIAHDEAEKEEEMRKREERKLKRAQKVLQNKSRLETSYNEHIETLNKSMETKINTSTMRYQRNLNEVQSNLSDQFNRERSAIESFKQHSRSQERIKQHFLIEKLVKKEEQNLERDKSMKKLMMQKIKSQSFKNETMKSRLDKLNNDVNNKINRLEEKFRKIEINNTKRKEDRDHEIEKIQELRLLKRQDLKDNYDKKRRMDELKFQKMLYKSQKFKEKRELNRVQSELLRKVQILTHQMERSNRNLLEERVATISLKSLDKKPMKPQEQMILNQLL